MHPVFSKPFSTLQMVSQPPKPPSSKLVTDLCHIDRTRLVAVRRPNGFSYTFEYDSDLDKMTPHACICQTKVSQSGLHPLYSTYSEKISATVLFVFNRLTTKTEQYVYHFETDHFEQVENTGLVFNPSQTLHHAAVALLKGPNDEQIMIERDQAGGIRKMFWKSGCFKIMDPSRVDSLLIKSFESRSETIEEEDDSEYDSDEDSEEDAAFNKHIASLEPYMVSTCGHGQVVNVFNYKTHVYRGFAFNDATGDFHLMDCGCEVEIKVKENSLRPKYVEYHDSKYVIHVDNTTTGLLEKYCIENGGLRQVDYPELVFNYDKVTTSPVMIVSTQPGGTMVILRNGNGRLSREKYCSAQSRYVTMNPEPVKTFIVQRKEAEKKRKEERKLRKKVEAMKLEEMSTLKAQGKRAIVQKLAEEHAARRQEAEKENAPKESEAVKNPTEKPTGLAKLTEQAPSIKPARVPKVPLTSTVSQTDITRAEPLTSRMFNFPAGCPGRASYPSTSFSFSYGPVSKSTTDNTDKQ